MNDLAEKALLGLDAARRQVRGRPLLCFGVLGFGVAAVLVVAGGAVGAAQPMRPLTTWLALQDPGHAPTGPAPAILLIVAVAALVLLWLAVVEFVHRARPPAGRIWWVAAAWAAPFAVGPPLLDTSVYSYAAYGLVQRLGHDPYQWAPSRLGSVPAVAALDPGARGTPTAGGPLATVLQHVAVSAGSGSALGAVIALRVLAVVAVVTIGRLATQLGGDHSDRALTLTVLNPLVLLYLISAARLDAVLIALVLAAVVAATQQRWLSAVTLAAVAGSVEPQGFVALLVIIAVHATRRRTTSVWRVLARDVPVAAAISVAATWTVPDHVGWLATVGKQFATHTPYSVAGATSVVLTPIVRGASYDDFAIGGRVTALAAMVCAVGYLLVTVRHRPPLRSVGYALLAVGLLAPALHPWYLLWGTLCLAPAATGGRRIAVVTLSAAGCVLAPQGFAGLTTHALTGALLAVIAAAAGLAWWVEQRAAAGAPEPASTGTDAAPAAAPAADRPAGRSNAVASNT